MLLARTRRLRGGVLVSGAPYRHPAVLANMAVTIDIASGGRLELGIGAGWFEAECEAYGIELGSITERFDRFEESLAVTHSLLTEPTTTFSGRYYELTDAYCEPKATQSPHPPFVLGGKGERRFLPLVARFADHWNYSGEDPAELRRLRGRLGELCEAEGRRVEDLTVSAIVRPTPQDPPAMLDQVGAFADAGATMVFVGLPRPYDPRILEPMATAALAPGDLTPAAIERPGRAPTSAVGEDDGAAFERAALERGEGVRDLVEAERRDGGLEDAGAGQRDHVAEVGDAAPHRRGQLDLEPGRPHRVGDGAAGRADEHDPRAGAGRGEGQRERLLRPDQVEAQVDAEALRQVPDGVRRVRTGLDDVVGAERRGQRAGLRTGVDRDDGRRRHRPEDLHREVTEPADADHRHHGARRQDPLRAPDRPVRRHRGVRQRRGPHGVQIAQRRQLPRAVHQHVRRHPAVDAQPPSGPGQVATWSQMFSSPVWQRAQEPQPSGP